MDKYWQRGATLVEANRGNPQKWGRKTDRNKTKCRCSGTQNYFRQNKMFTWSEMLQQQGFKLRKLEKNRTVLTLNKEHGLPVQI